MKMPLATFEGSIRVGQEKAVIAEEITLTFGYADAAAAPVAPTAAGGAKHSDPAPSPLRVALNA
jgi:hypothetical protein